MKRVLFSMALAVILALNIQSCGTTFKPAPKPVFLDSVLSQAIPDDLIKFPVFESGPVRPIALSADGKKLFVTNIPDGRLEIFAIDGEKLDLIDSVFVGLEPVALAVRNNGEVWVVNHLSDSVSVVDTTKQPSRIVKTLFVGDEPRDIVFAGPNDQLAFITAAHRGQNVPFDPQLKTPSVGRSDVWVFDVRNLGRKLGGEPVTIINMFGDTLRGLARNADGSKVYAAVLNSGNKTTTIVPHHPFPRLVKPSPINNYDGDEAPHTGLIVQHNGKEWVDHGDPVRGVVAKEWSEYVRFTLPDNDVFEIDAMATPPAFVKAYQGVGTSLFNVVVNPVNEKIYVSNTEARNIVRFEGKGESNTTVRGHFAESRITVIDNDAVLPRHLNKHIQSYDQPLGTAKEKALSVAMPLQMQTSQDGKQLFVAAFSSSKIAIYDTHQLESDAFEPSLVNQIKLSNGGPGGLALNDSGRLLYVYTRFNNGVSVIDVEKRKEIAVVAMNNPEPDHVVKGRRFLYDAEYTSSRGDSSCGGCHLFGDMDHLAWDLGDPEGDVTDNPREYVFFSERAKRFHHPMKGPMTTQSLRGLPGHGPMHWRGDRTGSTADKDETLEEQAFEDFNTAFVGLLGREKELTDDEMNAFAKFALALYYPPNPIRRLDNTLTITQAAGRDAYFNADSTAKGLFTCNFCHTLDVKKRRFGTVGLMTLEGITVDEDMKIPHLRNIYQKLGMFGGTGDPADGRKHVGEQIRGFGLMHDGSMDTVTDFLIEGSREGGAMFVFKDEKQREAIVDFVHVMDAELAPIVGQQVTLTANNRSHIDVLSRVNLLHQQAKIVEPRAECDLAVQGVISGKPLAALQTEVGDFQLSRQPDKRQSLQTLKAMLNDKSDSLTFTCVPPGSGYRIGFDRSSDVSMDIERLGSRYE